MLCLYIGKFSSNHDIQTPEIFNYIIYTYTRSCAQRHSCPEVQNELKCEIKYYFQNIEFKFLSEENEGNAGRQVGDYGKRL